MALFCEFCECSDCANGSEALTHAHTSDGRWICDVCYLYDLCTSGSNRNWSGPCDDMACVHRPAIDSAWETYAEWKARL